MLDLAIVGGGPGGLMAARHLGQKTAGLYRAATSEAPDAPDVAPPASADPPPT